MKWPIELTLIRHGQSAYNVLKARKANDEAYQRFVQLYRTHPNAAETKELAHELQERFALGVGDYETLLTQEGERQALITGQKLRERSELPEIIFYSPYRRTRQTLEHLKAGWPELGEVRTVEDDRIREQEHGLAVLYNDRRIFHTFHPEQRQLQALQGSYWYQYPQGESVSMVRDRVRSMVGTLVREYSGWRVLMVTHHLTILSIRGIMERLTPEEFQRLDEHDKPVNCGVTTYHGEASLGRDGRLMLKDYNRRFY